MTRMTRTTHVVLGLTATLLLCLLSAGCDTGPALAPVEGTVTLDGTAVQGAEVTFQPTAEGGSPSVGITDANGHYELKFTMKEKGALVGEHVVRISVDPDADPDEGGAGGEVSDVEIPARYNMKSELKRTVEKGGGTFNFDLESGE
jgi:hypothetical protein